jgi:hypothetical protein
VLLERIPYLSISHLDLPHSTTATLMPAWSARTLRRWTGGTMINKMCLVSPAL